jgi:hypothetical protein
VLLPNPCWVLVRANGDVVDEDEREPHHDTQAEAVKAAPGYAREGEPAPKPKPLIDKCYVATAECGYRFDEREDGIHHGPDRDALQAMLLHLEWRPGPDGAMGCGDKQCRPAPSCRPGRRQPRWPASCGSSPLS